MLLVIPLVSLIGLWGFAAQLTLKDALNKFQISTTYNKIGIPGQNLAGVIQYERKASAVFIAAGRPTAKLANGTPNEALQGLLQIRGMVDLALKEFKAKALNATINDESSGAIEEQRKKFVEALDKLPEIRDAVDRGGFAYSPIRAIEDYSSVVGTGINLFASLVIVDDLRVYQEGHALIGLGWARDFIMREDTLLTVAMVQQGKMNMREHQMFAGWVQTNRHLQDTSYLELSDKNKITADGVVGGQTYKDFLALEDRINATQGRLTPDVTRDWPNVSNTLIETWSQALNNSGAQLKADAEPIGDRIVFRLVFAGGLGLLAVIFSIVMTVLLARNLSRELRGLQAAARELAEQRLPWVVSRLRRGESVDVAKEIPPLDIPTRTAEVAKVAEAFNRVQRTAMETSVGEAHLRKGISRVFLNLAWRSQSLLHRQLRMLDALERRAPDPDTLNDLFQLDHLTTRMRRHAEGLIILSGAAPGRTWSKPVHITDVLRGAVAEVEDYTRVEVISDSPVALAGAAVADVIHMLAELVENGTAYSPPPTEVTVHGEVVGNGFAVEIIDRGVGLTTGEFIELNQRLAQAPEFDLADTDRLGLFVVSRLAARHGIKVTLQPSAYGGVSAVALLPHSLIVPESAINDPIEQPRLPQAVMAESVHQPTGPQPVTGQPVGGPQPVPAIPAEDGGLPKRVRQGNLAPQLRNSADSSAENLAAPVPVDDERAPEDSRNLFSSLQAGWERARDEHEDGS
ncbi:sensor histidine kinase [Actinocorallia longicatena]|uniref:sensor histidine kinase n=1 Tax=Actinocorallia longicatena TaxID=111803 RepID=UPI0031D9825C